MADIARLVLFSSVYLFLPSFILILSPGRFQLKSINCWDVSFPPCRECWVPFGCGFFLAQREEQQDSRAVPVLGVCLYVLQRCPVGVALSFLGSATHPQQQQGHCSVPPRLVPHQELCVSPQVLMDLAEGSVGFYFNLYFSCKPKLEVEMADPMLRDNFGQLSVGPEILGEVRAVPPKKQSPVGHCKILRMIKSSDSSSKVPSAWPSVLENLDHFVLLLERFSPELSLDICLFLPHPDQSQVLVTPGDEASLMLKLPARASFLSPSILELVIKLQSFGNAHLGAICVPNPAEYIFSHRFVTVAVGGELHGRSAFRRMPL